MGEEAETIAAGVRAVVVRSGSDGAEFADDSKRLLQSLLERTDFFRRLDLAREAVVEIPQDFPIVIKPDLDLFAHGLPSFTDPQLIEHLIDLLHDHGYTSVSVAAGCNVADQWLDNRPAPIVADLAGYRFATPAGRSYQVFDLADDLIEYPFPQGSALHGATLSRRWVQSRFRIDFAKNKTDAQFGYGLCLYNLLGVIPLAQRHDRSRRGIPATDQCVELLTHLAPHFCIIDALTSNHGRRGWLTARPLVTGTLIASTNLLLCDWAGAAKMGVDPYDSPLNAAGLARFGLPTAYAIDGDLMTYPLWVNAHPAVTESIRRRDHVQSVAPFLRAQSQAVDQDIFPFKDALSGKIREVVARYLDQPGSEPAAFVLTVGLNYLLAALKTGGEALAVLANKPALRWLDAPLQGTQDAYAPAEFDAVQTYLEPLEALLQHTPPDRNGLRWRYLDKSVLFEFRHVIPVPYEHFVRRVDVSRAIQFMTDYIGGSCTPVAKDGQGRPIHQLERNLYLQQPNWMALFGGKMIDVEKIERITYAADRHRICWRTIRSANASAEFDDGSVTFAPTSSGHTGVTVVGRQKFTLPLVWQMVDLDRWPEVKDFLVTQAYTQFFSKTMENLQAVYEDRPYRIGHPVGAGHSNDDGTQLSEWVSRAVAALKEIGANGSLDVLMKRLVPSRDPRRAPPKSDGVLDADGFCHFTSTAAPTTPTAPTFSWSASQPSGGATLFSAFAMAGREASGFFTGLLDAMRKDLQGPS